MHARVFLPLDRAVVFIKACVRMGLLDGACLMLSCAAIWLNSFVAHFKVSARIAFFGICGNQDPSSNASTKTCWTVAGQIACPIDRKKKTQLQHCIRATWTQVALVSLHLFDLIFLVHIENAYGKKLTADCIGGLGSRYLAWYSPCCLSGRRDR